MVKHKLRISVAYFLLLYVPRYYERELLFNYLVIPVRLFISHFHSIKSIHSIQYCALLFLFLTIGIRAYTGL
jgi:hypothetical protein